MANGWPAGEEPIISEMLVRYLEFADLHYRKNGKTPNIVGSRIKVTNMDGSSHVEKIIEWQPDRRLRLHLKEFSAPLVRLATWFEETWDFERSDNATKVTRSFKLHAKSALTRPLLMVISILLKKAITRHLRQMRFGASS